MWTWSFLLNDCFSSLGGIGSLKSVASAIMWGKKWSNRTCWVCNNREIEERKVVVGRTQVWATPKCRLASLDQLLDSNKTLILSVLWCKADLSLYSVLSTHHKGPCQIQSLHPLRGHPLPSPDFEWLARLCNRMHYNLTLLRCPRCTIQWLCTSLVNLCVFNQQSAVRRFLFWWWRSHALTS